MIETPVETVERLHMEAAGRTGLVDFGADDHREAMAVLVDSYARDAGLTETGAARVDAELRSILGIRLRLVQARHEYADAAKVEIRRPVFVTGLPRTGTTALHRLLCVDPLHQGLEHWLTERPQPRPPREEWADNPGYQRLERMLDAHHAANPDMKGLHFMSPDAVEECWRAERLSMRSIAFQNSAHLPSYASWLAQQDMAPSYRAHHEMLQLIGLNDQDRRWVLKSPSHIFGIDALLETYPDALIVQTHRHPRTIVASVSSLNSRSSVGTSTVFTPDVVGRDCLEMWSRGARQAMEARSRHAPEHFLDVAYEDFVTDAVGVVGSIYERLGVPFEGPTRDAVRTSHEESKNSDRRPAHRYSLEEFGLTARDVDEAFEDYLQAHFSQNVSY